MNWIALGVILVIVGLVLKKQEESFGYTEDQLLKYQSVLGAPSPSVPAVFVPTSTHLLPQQGFEPGSRWANVTQALKYPTLNTTNFHLDWKSEARSTCSAYNTPIAPRSQQDCPDSSFAYVTDMSRFIPGAKHSGCIQTGNSSSPWCYSQPNGKYEPSWERIAANSP